MQVCQMQSVQHTAVQLCWAALVTPATTACLRCLLLLLPQLLLLPWLLLLGRLLLLSPQLPFLLPQQPCCSCWPEPQCKITAPIC